MYRNEPRSAATGKGLGKGMIIAAWVLLLGLFTFFFSRFLDQQYNPNQRVQTAVTGAGAREVVLQRNRAGHYLANGRINGQPVVFLLDTGATDVAVPLELARRLGLSRGNRSLSRTANGTVTTWQTRLDEVALGNIRMRNVRASLLPGMGGDEVLLGMSFLKRLELVQRGDSLTLRQTRADS